jgi:hypothetical protein
VPNQAWIQRGPSIFGEIPISPIAEETCGEIATLIKHGVVPLKSGWRWRRLDRLVDSPILQPPRVTKWFIRWVWSGPKPVPGNRIRRGFENALKGL